MTPLMQQVLVTCAVALLLSSHKSCDAAATSVPVVVSSVSRSTLSASDIAFDKNLSLLYVSYAYCAVYRLPANSATPQLIAGNPTASGSSDGIGSSARFTNPVGITCDAASNVAYICDFTNHRIRTLDLNSNSVSTLAGALLWLRRWSWSGSPLQLSRGNCTLPKVHSWFPSAFEAAHPHSCRRSVATTCTLGNCTLPSNC
ncbi:Hypothetical protein, putative [Bodo saltans]|uniref:Membrane-associated protein n=1 Tax=Bodo saltans TaxID=75058 RepID=A0A0S4KIW7_BODSA|nr:Hypothetical protein, putative [Bodo saltans]|eukprot:CUI14474.1 Hypothetical protein, putative [Bodo saltans]